MPANEGGYLRRLAKKLARETDARGAQHQSAEPARGDGPNRAADCRSGEEVVLLGKLRAVAESSACAALEAELVDSSGEATLVWLGRRRIPGIEPGRILKVRGRLAERDGRKVLYNPYYELQVTT